MILIGSWQTLMKAILKVEKVMQKIGKGLKEIVVFHDVSFTIHKGEFATIITPQGYAKNTLLTMFGGLLRPTSGKIIIQDTNIYEQSKEALIEFRQKHIGIINQHALFLPYLNLIDNVLLPLHPQKLPRQEEVALAKFTLDRVGLGDKCEHYPEHLSNEEQMRASIARAIVKNPALLIIYDPNNGNEEFETNTVIMELLKTLNQQGQTILFITEKQDWAQYSNRVFTIENKTIKETLVTEPYIRGVRHRGGDVTYEAPDPVPEMVHKEGP